MEIDRRTLLLGAAASALAGMPFAAAGAAQQALYAAARKGSDGRYSAAIFSEAGHDIRAVDLPGRGHDITVSHVDRSCVVFARRPGNFAVAFSIDAQRPPILFTTPADRHFYGHGVFSHDDRLLYATENDFDGARGIIGIYDAGAGYRRIGEFASGGMGPHDLALIDGGTVLVVANGGLREHPDFGRGRRILNPGAIDTTLSYIDVRTGDLLERHDLGAPGSLSLRHLDVAGDGTVIIGAQLVDRTDGKPAMVYRHRRQQALATIALPADVEAGLSGYVSSIACDSGGELVAVTSSRGALAVVIDVATGRVVRTQHVDDVSGVVPTPEPVNFLTTTGHGAIDVMRGDGAVSHDPVATPWAWDNHAVLVTDAWKA
jgi:hypothetical protein